MYPTRELIEIARRKAILRQSIARCRIEYATAAASAAKPIAWIDEAYKLWRRLTPILAVFSSAFGGFATSPRSKLRKIFSIALRLAPTLFRTFAAFRRGTKARDRG